MKTAKCAKNAKSGIRLEFQESNAVVVEARPLSERATADRILLSPAQTTGGLG